MSLRQGCSAGTSDSHSSETECSRATMPRGKTGSEVSLSSLNPSEAGQFDCNICLDTAFDPVVTLCGHLYCWPCIYKWARLQAEGQFCPVCKARISKDKVIPIYGRGRPQIDPRKKSMALPATVEQVPDRPPAQRQDQLHELRSPSWVGGNHLLLEEESDAPSPRWARMRGMQTVPPPGTIQPGAPATLSAGLSFLPTFFGLHFSSFSEPGGSTSEGLSPEQAQQALLSRLLLLLGSMVILCLLLF